MMNIVFDEVLGILRSVSEGSSTLAEVEAFGRRMAALQCKARARHGVCLHLVDAERTAVHTKEAAALFAEQAATHRKPGDRTAIVIASAIARMQGQRTIPQASSAYFATKDEALAWLLPDTAPSNGD